MDEQSVAVRVAEYRHPTDRGFDLIGVEFHSTFFHLRDGRVDIIHLERDRGAVARLFPIGMRTDTNRDCAELVLHPRHAGAEAGFSPSAPS